MRVSFDSVIQTQPSDPETFSLTHVFCCSRGLVLTQEIHSSLFRVHSDWVMWPLRYSLWGYLGFEWGSNTLNGISSAGFSEQCVPKNEFVSCVVFRQAKLFPVNTSCDIITWYCICIFPPQLVISLTVVDCSGAKCKWGQSTDRQRVTLHSDAVTSISSHLCLLVRWATKFSFACFSKKYKEKQSFNKWIVVMNLHI